MAHSPGSLSRLLIYDNKQYTGTPLDFKVLQFMQIYFEVDITLQLNHLDDFGLFGKSFRGMIYFELLSDPKVSKVKSLRNSGLLVEDSVSFNEIQRTVDFSIFLAEPRPILIEKVA